MPSSPMRRGRRRSGAVAARRGVLRPERARDPQALRRLYETEMEIGQDVPQPDRFPPVPFEMFVEQVVASP